MTGRTLRLTLVLTACGSLAACVTPQYATKGPASGAKPPAAGGGRYLVGDPYQVGGVWYVPHEQPDYDEVGVASWYGDAFQLKPTANGEVFDMNGVSAAHTTLPLPSMVEVTNLENGRKLYVRVNDRGPFVGGRIIDLSHEAARELGYDRQGVAKVRVRYVGPAPLLGPDAGVRQARLTPPPAAARPAAQDDEVMQIAAGAAPRPSPQALPPSGPPPAPAATAEAAAPKTVAPASDEIQVTALAPLAPSAPTPAIPAPVTPASPSPPTVAAAPPAPTPGLRVQAGAFASQANAERAVSQLAPAGRALIEPFDRGGVTLYRVVLPAPGDEVTAYALRDRVAQIGFPDARVVGSF